MKKIFIYTAVMLLLAVTGLTGCRKDNAAGARPNVDKSAVVRNTTWTGEFNYSGKAAEPMVIEFSEDGRLTWRELLGNHAGTWKLDGAQLSISLDGALSFKGNISDDHTLTGVQSSDAGQRTLDNAVLDQGTITALPNTVWIAPSLRFNFKAGDVLDVYINKLPSSVHPDYANIPYVVNGRTVKFSLKPNYDWFAVIRGNATMKGTNHAPGDPTVYAFVATRQ